jgi:hypothetical protein
MIKICAFCNIEFENNTKTTFCTRSCQVKSQWSKPGVKEKASKIQKEIQNRPEIKKKVSDGNKISQNRPDVKLATSKRMKKLWSNKDFNIKMKEYYNREDVCKDHSVRMKKAANMVEFKENIRKFQLKYSNLPEVRKFHSDIAKQLHIDYPELRNNLKNLWKSAEFRNKMIIIQKEVQNRPERKELNKKTSIELWKNPIFADKLLKSAFKYKQYIMPSGKIIKIQGYEHFALDKLIEKYTEEDIIVETKNLNKEIGRISYMENNIEHTYIPDLYIKSTNTIIEVKSDWTYELHKEINELKKQACLDMGFNFEFMIFNKTYKN